MMRAWLGLGAGAGVVVTAAIMLTRTLRPVLEAREYVRETGEAAEAMVHNLAALSGLARTRDLAAAVRRELEGTAP